MKGRSTNAVTLLLMLWTLPFVGMGILLVYGGLFGTSGSSNRIILVLVGALIAGFCANQIRLGWRGRRSPESLQAPHLRAPPLLSSPSVMGLENGYRTAGRAGQSAGALYAPILEAAPLPRPKTRPGTNLAVALGPARAKSSPFVVAFALLWSVAALIPFALTLLSHQWGAAAFLSAFLAIGVGLLSWQTKMWLARMKLPRVELSSEPVYLGDEIVVHVEQRGPARVLRLRVDLLCREEVTYGDGTSRRTEHRDVLEQELLDVEGRRLRVGERWPHEMRVVVPAGAPHSFKSTANALGWFIRTRAEIAGWPDYDELFELRALPRVPG